jgi:uroporphyrinogen decarboxylase
MNMKITQKALVRQQIAHQETPFLPYRLNFEGNVAERLDAHYGGTAWRDLLDNAIQSVPGLPLGVGQSDEPTSADLFGSVWRTDRRPMHLIEPALKEPSLEGYQFPPMEDVFTPDWEIAARRFIEDHPSTYVVAGFGFGLFERTWTMRGFNEALMDAAANPAFYADLVEAIADHQLEIIERLLALPVDGIWFSDDWGYQQGVLLGPMRWRRFIKPHLARMYERVHAAGRHTLSHCCGSVYEIMPDIIEIGLDVLESVQPEARGMNPYELKAAYGSDITFFGGLGSQSTVPFGTPEEIKAEVRRLCSVMGEGGGYILGPAKALQPETPTANAAAVVEAFLAQAGQPLP